MTTTLIDRPKPKPRDGMTLLQITDVMVKAVQDTEPRFPRAVTVPCVCDPAPKRKHLPHQALPMAVPVAISATVTLGGIRVH